MYLYRRYGCDCYRLVWRGLSRTGGGLLTVDRAFPVRGLVMIGAVLLLRSPHSEACGSSPGPLPAP